MFEGETMVVFLVVEVGDSYKDVYVRLRVEKVGLLINHYELLGACDANSGEEIFLTREQLIEAETTADLIFWGITQWTT